MRFGLTYNLEEIIGRSSCHMWLSPAGSWVKLQEGVLQIIVQFDHGGLVSTAIAVIWSRKYGYDVSIMTPVITLKEKYV